MMDAKWLFYMALAIFLIGFPLATVGHIDYCDSEKDCRSFFEKFTSQPPNEIGDTLAGVFGSLAFVAAAVAIVLQSLELAEQRKEIREQRKATQEMAASLEKQAEIFQKEQEQREFEQARRLFDVTVIRISDWFDELSPSSHISLSVKIPGADGGVQETEESGFLIPCKNDGEFEDQYVKRVCTGLMMIANNLQSSKYEVKFVSGLPNQFSDFLDSLVKDLKEQLPTLNREQQRRYLNLRLHQIEKAASGLEKIGFASTENT